MSEQHEAVREARGPVSAGPLRCAHCATAAWEVALSDRLDAWICSSCHWRGVDALDVEREEQAQETRS